MDAFIHWSKPYLLLSATYDETLSWMIEIWMKNYLVSDNDCNNISLKSPPQEKKNYKECQLMLSSHLVLVTLYCGLQLVLVTLDNIFTAVASSPHSSIHEDNPIFVNILT
jgi:hypothetical protein